MATSTSTAGKERRLKINVLRERKKIIIDPTLIKSYNLQELPVICDKI